MRTAGAFPGAGAGVEPAHKGLKLPAEILTPHEILAILAACRNTVTGIRDRALITVMYRSGLRIGEALALQPKDVDLHIGSIAVLHGTFVDPDRHPRVLAKIRKRLLMNWLESATRSSSRYETTER